MTVTSRATWLLAILIVLIAVIASSLQPLAGRTANVSAMCPYTNWIQCDHWRNGD